MRLKGLLRGEQICLALFIAGLIAFAGCASLEQQSRRPRLHDVRAGKVQGQAAEDLQLGAGEISGTIAEINPSRYEIQVINEKGQRQLLNYELHRLRVVYHGVEYSIDDLKPGDRIAFETRLGSGGSVESIRVQVPVAASAIGSSR